MKIFLPFKSQATGGSLTFATKFKAGMERRGHEVFFDFRDNYDVVLLIAQGPFPYLLHAKRNKKPIVQRFDAVPYWSVASWKFPLLNAKATYARYLFVDFTVYQSQYSKYCVEKVIGKKPFERATIIHNGVDLQLFSPNGLKRNLRDHPRQKIFLTAEDFRRKEQIVPIIQAFEIYKKKYGENCKLLVAGSFRGEAANVPHEYQDVPDLVFLGRVKNHELPSYERAADIFLHTHLNPACPNNVIEAMACGLPICGVADGSMPELVEVGSNGLLVPTSGDAFWRRRSIERLRRT